MWEVTGVVGDSWVRSPCLLDVGVQLTWLNVCADDVRSSFHVIEYEIGEYMARYEVR